MVITIQRAINLAALLGTVCVLTVYSSAQLQQLLSSLGEERKCEESWPNASRAEKLVSEPFSSHALTHTHTQPRAEGGRRLWPRRSPTFVL